MNRVPLGQQIHQRDYGQEVSIRLVNRFFETNPASAEGAALLSRPGTLPAVSVSGTAPFGNLFSREGLFQDDLFYTSMNGLHRGYGGAAITGSSGIVTDSSFPVSYAAASGIGYEHLFMTRDLKLYVYDGTSVSEVVVPVGVRPNKVVSLGAFVVVTDLDNDQFYYIRPGETTIDALDFESAESEADAIVGLLPAGDLLWILGGSSIEAWYLSGDAERPIQRMPGMTHRIGAYAAGATSVKGIGFFIGTDNIVYMLDGASPRRVSTHSIEERVRFTLQGGGEDAAVSWGFPFDGHLFYSLTLSPHGTFVYDVLTEQWSQWVTTSEGPYWNMVQGVEWSPLFVGVPWDGSSIIESGFPMAPLRDDDEPIERVVTGYLPHRARDSATNSLFRVYAGWQEPGIFGEQVSLRFSDDGEKTWNGPYPLSPIADEPAQTFEWRSLGRVGESGRIFEVTDYGGLVRIDGAYAQTD